MFIFSRDFQQNRGSVPKFDFGILMNTPEDKHFAHNSLEVWKTDHFPLDKMGDGPVGIPAVHLPGCILSR